jgi:hypothetical protein
MAAAFKGVIKLDVRDSRPDWTPYELKKAPTGAPNVLIVLYDDGAILGVVFDVGDDVYLDLEKEAVGAFARD